MQDGLKRMNRIEDSLEKGVEPYDWPMSRSSPEEYAQTFYPIIGTSLQKHFAHRKSQGLNNVCLDLASDGWVFTGLRLPHDGALAVGISDPSTIGDNRIRYDMGDVSVVAGNLVKQTTWNEIDAWLAKRNVPSFDQVFFRPGGGIPLIGVQSDYPKSLHPIDSTTNEELMFGLLNRVLQRLSPNGEIFAELGYGTEFDAKAMESRLRAALNTATISATVRQNTLKLLVVHIHKIH